MQKETSERERGKGDQGEGSSEEAKKWGEKVDAFIKKLRKHETIEKRQAGSEYAPEFDIKIMGGGRARPEKERLSTSVNRREMGTLRKPHRHRKGTD